MRSGSYLHFQAQKNHQEKNIASLLLPGFHLTDLNLQISSWETNDIMATATYHK